MVQASFFSVAFLIAGILLIKYHRRIGRSSANWHEENLPKFLHWSEEGHRDIFLLVGIGLVVLSLLSLLGIVR